MKQTGRGRGFTLAEILIVVVILGVLASLAIPRFLNQSKRAESAEAIQMIGAMQRVATSYQDANRPPLALNQLSTDLQWENFGMSSPNISKLWYYWVNIAGMAADFYAIYRADGFGAPGPYSAGPPITYMKLTVNGEGVKTWSCVGALEPLSSATGCQFT